MNAPLLLNISQLVTAAECTVGQAPVGSEASRSKQKDGFAQLLANLMAENESGSILAALKSAESPETLWPPLEGGEISEESPVNPGMIAKQAEVQGSSEGAQTKFVTVDFAVESDALADLEGFDKEAVGLFDSLRGTLCISRRIDGQMIAPDLMQVKSPGGEAHNAAVLKLQSGDLSWTIPVEIADALSFTEENSGQQRFSLKFTDDSKLILTETDGQRHIQEERFDVVSRAEVAVRRTLLVTDPLKLVKYLLSDMPRIKITRAPSIAKSHGMFPAGEPSIDLTRLSNDSDHKATGIRESKQHFGRLQIERKAFFDKNREEYSQKQQLRPEESSQRQMQPNAGARQSTLEWGSEIERCVKILNQPQGGESNARTLEAAVRPVLPQEPVFRLASETAGNMRMSPPEPVKFSVHLHDIGLKPLEVSSFRVSIQPEDLGYIRVQLSMIEDRLTARLTVQSPAAGQAVESNLPALKDALLQHGIKVEQFAVNIAGGDAQGRDRNPRKGDQPELVRNKNERLHLDQMAQTAVQPQTIVSVRNHSGAINLIA